MWAPENKLNYKLLNESGFHDQIVFKKYKGKFLAELLKRVGWAGSVVWHFKLILKYQFDSFLIEPNNVVPIGLYYVCIVWVFQ